MGFQSDNTSADIVTQLDLNHLTVSPSSNVNMLMQHEDRSEEWVHVRPLEPLKVIIVGGGIGGMTAALALRQQGHHVEVGQVPATSMEFN